MYMVAQFIAVISTESVAYENETHLKVHITCSLGIAMEQMQRSVWILTHRLRETARYIFNAYACGCKCKDI